MTKDFLLNDGVTWEKLMFLVHKDTRKSTVVDLKKNNEWEDGWTAQWEVWIQVKVAVR